MPDNHPTTPGHGMSRRGFLAVTGLGSAALAVATLAPARADAAIATDTDQQEVGPFYVADGLVRSDVTEGQAGVAHTFTLTLTNGDTATPLVGAAVDIWQANALGVYSDEAQENTTGQTYLRGVQLTDSVGQVTFTSIMPGWYSGRTMHVHLRVYTGGSVSGTTYDYTGATLVHTGQMFFTETVSAAVSAVTPYTSNPNSPRTVNSADRVYTQQNGAETLFATTGSTSGGYTSTLGLTVAGGAASSADSTSLTIGTTATAITAGSAVTLSGVLLDSTTSGRLADQDITLSATSTSGVVRTKVIETDDDGAWSVTFTPALSATYSVSYAGTSAHSAATSSTVTVAVAYAVGVSSVSRTASAKSRVTATGTVAPARSGLTVTIYAVSASTGARQKITSVRTGSGGTWTAGWFAGKGRHLFAAAVPADQLDAAGSSRTVVYYRT